MTSKTFYALQFKSHQNFDDNLNRLIALVSRTDEDSVIVVPEVALTNFCYQRMEEASEFAKKATDTLYKLSAQRSIAITMIEKYKGHFYNNLKVFHNGDLVHKQSKTHLFPLGGEQLYFAAGHENQVNPFMIDGVKYAALNCFELRFPSLWNRIRGADIVLITAQWGESRKQHFEILSESLAIINQCFVVACNGANEKIAKGSAIISPLGIAFRNDQEEIISAQVDLSEIARVRKHIDVGLFDE